MPTAGRLVARRRLCDALRRARTQQAMTQQQVAEAMDWSLSKLIRVENGGVGISTNDLRVLLAHYEITDPAEVRTLTELARAGRRRPWWWEYRDQMQTPTLGKLIDLEASASHLGIFNPSIVPGLLQTEAYARTVLREVIPAPTPDQLDARVQVRLRRQHEVLGGEAPARVLAVLDEAVLRRMTADATTMRGQLDHLCALAERPNVVVKILPFSVGVVQLAGPFIILSFPYEDDPDVVYVESSLSEELITDQQHISYYHLAFEAIRHKALGPEASIDLIRKVTDELA